MIVPGHAPGSRYVVPPEAIAWACAVDAELAPHLLALAALESGFDPNAVANTACPNRPGYRPPGAGALPEYSVGLLQHNTCGGLGGSACCNLSPDDEARLKDPIYNLSLGAQAIRQRLAMGASLYDALSPWYNARNILAREGWFGNPESAPCNGAPPPDGNGTAVVNWGAVVLIGLGVLLALEVI